MTERDYRYRSESEAAPTSHARVAPGKRTLTECIPANAASADEAQGATSAATGGLLVPYVQPAPAGPHEDPFSMHLLADSPATAPGAAAIDAAGRAGLGDVSGVRIHTDTRAQGAADALDARAFTIGADVYFGAGQHQPGTPDGDRLLGHELAHASQQRDAGSTALAAKLRTTEPGDAAEVEADRAGDAFAAALAGGAVAPVALTAAPIALARSPKRTPSVPPAQPDAAPLVLGQSRPLDPFGQSRPLDPRGQSFADPSRDADGDGRADLFVAPRPAAPRASATPTGPTSPSKRATQLHQDAQDAIADINLIPSTLLPAYAEARDALEPDALQALAADILTKYQRATEVRDQLRPIVDPRDPGHAAHDVVPATPETSADRGLLQPMLGAVDAALTLVEVQLATGLGPTHFQGRAVAGGVAPVRIAKHAHLTVPRLLREAINTGELVAAVAEIRDLLPGGALATMGAASTPIDAGTSRAIADRLAPFASRPVHIAFLKMALTSLGLWAQIEHATGSDGRSLGQVDDDATAQAARFGAGADLGTYNPDQVLAVLKPEKADFGATKWTVTEAGAAKVIDAISAIEDPEARAAVLKDLEDRGLLNSIAKLAPPARVERLHDSLPLGPSRHVKTVMRPHFEGRDTTDNSVGTALEGVPGVGGALHTAANIATFGFLDEHDAAYRALKAGEITAEEYNRVSGRALLRAGVVGAVSYATGGTAGAFAEGLTGSLAARGVVGRVAANSITGAAAGSAGAVGGRLGSDMVDGRLSSADAYAHDALMGGAIGGGLGGGLTTLGAAGAKFLPESVKTPLHRLAERFPSIADDAETFAAFQRLGAQGSRGVVRFTIGARRLLGLAADGAVTLSGGALRTVQRFATDTRALGAAAHAKAKQFAADVADGAGPQLAGAGAHGGDVRVSATAKASRPLHEPGPLDGPAVTILKAERLPDDLVSRAGDDAGSLFDDYGHGASYADDASDWRPHAHEEASELPRGLQDDRLSIVDGPTKEPNGNRPTWQESERQVSDDLDWADFTDQKSFLNGKEVTRGTPGSTRPDSYSAQFRISVDVKNYDIATSDGRSRLVKNVVGQMKDRAPHLPANTRQGVVIDTRGQTFRPEALDRLRARLVKGGGGMVNADDIVFLTE